MNILYGTLLLTAVYIALTSNLQPGNIVAGLLLSAGVMILLRPAGLRTKIRWRFSAGGFLALARYIAILIYDLIVSGIQVARLVLDPELPVRQGNIAIPTNSTNEAAQALSAHAITVTPGELVAEMGEDGTMYTHVLDATHAEENVVHAQEMRDELLEKIAM